MPKKWLILGSASIIAIVIYTTRGFWQSLEWWVYVLAAGIVLIVLPLYNELLKSKGSNLKIKFLSIIGKTKNN